MEFYRQEYVVKKILTEIKPDERTEWASERIKNAENRN